MLAAARDVWGVFFLEKELGKLREQYLALALEGKPPSPEFWKKGEESIVGQQQSLFYTPELRKIVKPATASINDAEDFTNRTQRLAEQAVFMMHRILIEIPFVGQAEFQER
jgi:hypothetical protein